MAEDEQTGKKSSGACGFGVDGGDYPPWEEKEDVVTAVG